jgi:hypothetical protein
LARRFLLLIQFLSILWFLKPAQVLSTELRIHPQDESGRTLMLSRAAVYLDIWGDGHSVALEQNEHGVKLPLDPAWACSAWPETCGRNVLWGARLILHAEGYAPVTSRTFMLLGTQSHDANPPAGLVDTVNIELEGIPAVSLKDGETKEIMVPFRRAAPRSLRLVDRKGTPLTHVPVIDSLLFAQSNHCGAVEGETLLEGKTDESGVIQIPDVAGECAFTIFGDHYALQESRISESPIVAIRRLQAPITTIVLRALEKRDVLKLEFTNGGIPLVGLQLMSCRDHACGASCGKIEGETDKKGRVLLKEYYPEEVLLILQDHSGKVYWKEHVPTPNKSGWTKVEIKGKNP